MVLCTKIVKLFLFLLWINDMMMLLYVNRYIDKKKTRRLEDRWWANFIIVNYVTHNSVHFTSAFFFCTKIFSWIFSKNVELSDFGWKLKIDDSAESLAHRYVGDEKCWFVFSVAFRFPAFCISLSWETEISVPLHYPSKSVRHKFFLNRLDGNFLIDTVWLPN